MSPRYLISILLLINIAGCARSASGPSYSQPVAISSDKAVVYFYRNKRFFQWGTYPYVIVDGQKLFPLRNGGYNVVSLPPGRHLVEPKPGLSWTLELADIELNLEAGSLTCLRFVMTDEDLELFNGGLSGAKVSGKARFVQVSENIARAEIKDTKLSN